jgi:precorrin-6A/cobalt-precorrin-6A reductase
VEEAAEKVPPGCCVFVTTGRQELAPFWKRKDVWLLVRVIDPLKVAIDSERGIVIAARGPFSIESEIDLMGKHQITWLVSKNSGGPSTYAKIEAARALGLPVIMVARPKPIDDSGEQHDSIQGIIDWLERVVD